MRPTSWATSKGTGRSSPTQLGMAPSSDERSTTMDSSSRSTMSQGTPFTMNLAEGAA